MLGRKQTAETAESQEERFLKAFEDYNDALFRHAAMRISNRERAIDAVHDTYTKVWSYVKAGHQIDSYRSFLYKVLNNLIIDEYRKQKEHSLDALLEKEGVDELGPKEIGELIEESENVVSVRIHRALKLLRNKIEAGHAAAETKRTTKHK